MATIVQSTDYPSVRAALDTSLDSTTLPDATIAFPIFLDAADLEIKRRDPLWASRSGDAATHLKNAAIYLTAALIAPAVRQVIEETLSANDYRYRLQPIDWAARAAELRALVEQELNAYLETSTTTPDRPTMFTVAHGTRGKW